MHHPTPRFSRRMLAILGATMIVSSSLLVASTALAVNATGAFEITDGDPTTGNSPGNDDADRVCYQDAVDEGLTATEAEARCGVNTGTTNAVAGSATWVDAQGELTIFTGGGSKDPQDPGNDWLWKPKDTVPDKDTLEHAFAVRYSLPPDATTCPSEDPTCEVIYFGVDRFDNSGDAQLGFWFFQQEIALTDTASQGGFKFSGHHVNGDLLLISQFSNGGGTATIEAHFWDNTCAKAANNNPQPGDCSAKNLRLQAKSDAARCDLVAPTFPFCGIVNPVDGTDATWEYTDKSGNNDYLQGEYYEAGVNLSDLGLGDVCFPSVLAESRASTSPTATLKDFVLANFQNCVATAVTTPSSSDAEGNPGTVAPGVPVTDTIVITGTGASNPPFPGDGDNDSDVVFSICGPIASGICDDSDAAHTDAPFGATKQLVHTATQGVSTATSDAVNTAGDPLDPGRYCFVGSWAGDSNYPDGASDNSARECFTVTDTTSMTTAQDWLPNDSATITSAGGTALNGTLIFTLHDSSDCTGTVLYTEPTISLTNAASPATRSTSNTTIKVTSSDTVSWKAVFTSSDANVSGSEHCETTTLTINNN